MSALTKKIMGYKLAATGIESRTFLHKSCSVLTISSPLANHRCFVWFQGFPQHPVQHAGEQPDQEEGVGEEEREQVEGLHQEEL